MKALLGILASLSICILSFSGCKEYKPVPPPEIRMNPNPVERYGVLMEIKNPPGPISVTSDAVYGMKNRGSCVPIDTRRSLGGSRPVFGESYALPVNLVSDASYEVTFYADALMDEDYYGKGVCYWEGWVSYRIHWRGVIYLVSGGVKLNKINSIVFICSKIESTSSGSCVQEQYSSNAEEESNFSVFISQQRE